MSRSVYVQGREVASLQAIGDFKSSLIYHEAAALDDFVSLTMRVRRDPYLWDDVLQFMFNLKVANHRVIGTWLAVWVQIAAMVGSTTLRSRHGRRSWSAVQLVLLSQA